MEEPPRSQDYRVSPSRRLLIFIFKYLIHLTSFCMCEWYDCRSDVYMYFFETDGQLFQYHFPFATDLKCCLHFSLNLHTKSYF